MKVKPGRPGLKVRNPVTMQFIPEQGIELKEGEQETYWFRRLKCGDVVVVEEIASSKEEDSKLNKNAGGGNQ